jgi:hypothetical protein
VQDTAVVHHQQVTGAQPRRQDELASASLTRSPGAPLSFG